MFFTGFDNSVKKVVMLLNGLAFGGGLELALCGDIILAVNTAKLAFPETELVFTRPWEAPFAQAGE